MPHDGQSPLLRQGATQKPVEIQPQTSVTSNNKNPQAYFALRAQDSDLMTGGCNLDFLEDDLFDEDVRKNRKKSNTFQFASRPGAQRGSATESKILAVDEEDQ